MRRDWMICDGYSFEESVVVQMEVNKCHPNEPFILVRKDTIPVKYAVQCFCGKSITSEFADPNEALDAFYNGDVKPFNGIIHNHWRADNVWL